MSLSVEQAASGEFAITFLGQTTRFTVDGNDRPTLGVLTAWTQVGPRAWDSTARVKGEVVSADHYVIWADQKMLTVTAEPKGQQAGQVAERLVLRRESGGPGLAGVWRDTRAVGDATAEYAVEGNQLRVHLSPGEERFFALADGKEYPWEFPGAVPGRITAPGRVVGPRALSFVLSDSGKPFHVATLTVSQDGKEPVIEQVHGTTLNAPERSRLVYQRR